MAELFGAIMRGLGFVLNAAYEAIPNYAIAIIILTVVTRALLIPLTVKQTKSMQAMQLAQPEMKEIQAKYKELQKKVKDRLELQQLRLKQNEEVQAVFRKHGANPASGCLPMLAQMPVFIALFSVMRASLLFTAVPVTALPADRFTAEEIKSTICRPVSDATGDSLELSCTTVVPGQEQKVQTFAVRDLQQKDGGGNVLDADADPALVAFCRPAVDGTQTVFGCGSATGTGHLPQDGDLFADVNSDRATVIGMHPGCSPSQANSDFGIMQCTANDSGGGLPKSLPYYLLVIAIAGTQYVSGKQMLARSKGPAQQQQQMMTRIMPVFFGLISLGFPTGLNTYYLVFNIWQMGQQWFIFKHMDQQNAAGGPTPKPRKPGLGERMRLRLEQQQSRALEAPSAHDEAVDDAPTPTPAVQKAHPRSKKGKNKKRKRR